MKLDSNFLIDKFLRYNLNYFSAKDFVEIVSEHGMKIHVDEAMDFLQESPYVFELSNGLFLTRAGLFSDKYFSFKPSKLEVENGVFFIGHRCVPFVDFNVHSSALNFYYNGKKLSKKSVEVENSVALDMYSLFGEEYSSQYVALDSANSELKLLEGDHFNLPYKVNITGVSIQHLIDSGEFKLGDRILCKVVNWSLGDIEIQIDSHGENVMQISFQDVERESWYDFAEEVFLESFYFFGACASIEAQLALIYAKYSDKLMVPVCGSVEELVQRSKKIGFEEFGVETRLWKKGESIPAVGSWNQCNEDVVVESDVNGVFSDIEFLPSYVTECALKDTIAYNDFDAEKLLNDLYPRIYEAGMATQNFVLLHLKSRHDILTIEYNRFADFSIKDIRRKILKLYFRVLKIISSIEMVCSDLSKYPQQPLVITSQIYEHLLQLLELIESDAKLVMDSIHDVEASVEGMEYNLDCSYQELKKVIDKEVKKGFSLIKKKGL